MRNAPIAGCLLSLFACWPAPASEPGSQDWREFWLSVNVEPVPPRDFLDVEFNGRIDNLTGGRISDETARQWVLADVRRSMGDLYASHHLRVDIANAGVFGPPGLNGTSDGIEEMRDKGIERVEAPMMAEIAAAAVIAVPKELQAKEPEAGLTDFVIVLLFRPKTAEAVLVYGDGRREVFASSKEKELRWQLDTGRFIEYPAVGPIWYQERGWSCRPDDSVVGTLCGLVKP